MSVQPGKAALCFPEPFPCTLSSPAQTKVSAVPTAETMCGRSDIQGSVVIDDGIWALFFWETCFSNPGHLAEGLVQDPRLALNSCTALMCMLKS